MCGIVAVWNRDRRPVDRTELRRAVASLAQRGPDDEGYVLIDTHDGRAIPCRGRNTRADGMPTLEEVTGDFDLALGHRRLAVVDTSVSGHQPMTTSDGRLWIVFNGMIYNFQELRVELESLGYRFNGRSDTEVILHAYDRWGADCVARFNGMWAFVLWNSGTRNLLVSRDRMGIKPLVYCIDDTQALFASEIASLSSFGALRHGMEPRALHHYLSLMQVPAPYTIYKRVFKLQPARNLTIDASSVNEHRYWRPVPNDRASTDTDEAIERLDALIRDSIRLRLLGDVSVGCFLSGGIDSGIIAAMAAGYPREQALATYTIATPSEPSVDESKWAGLVASALGTNHTQIDLTASDFGNFAEIGKICAEPFAISSVLGVYLIARSARSQVAILLSGDGADEIFAGYLHRHVDIDARWDRFPQGPLGRLHADRAMAAGEWVRWRPITRSTMISLRARSLFVSEGKGRDSSVMQRRCMLNDHEKHVLYAPSWRACLAEEDTIPWLRMQIPPCERDRVLRRQLHDIETMLHDEMTAKLDKGTMAWGIEGRAPFLDYRVVEMAISLGLSQRFADGKGKWLLRKIASRYLPAAILARPKRGFTIPLASWLRNELRTFLYDTLSPAAVRRVGIFDPVVVQELLEYFERTPNFQTAHMVFTLLCFQLWYDQWSTSGP